ncbi:MAG: universal stress protein [Dehalococcoidales bacterium]|nr:universal stress protein [Dehalococcoidales bacterium]
MFRQILVPVGGIRDVDEETVKLACRLAKINKGKVLVVYVVTVKRALPLDAEIESEIKKAEDILDNAEGIAAEEGYEVETDVLQAREVGPAIVDEAVERSVSLILMGISYKQRFGQFSLGNVVPYVLKNSPCPVILYQQHTVAGQD